MNQQDRDVLASILASAAAIAVAILIAAAAYFASRPAQSAAWDTADPAIKRWFQEGVVKRCCSNADAYEADFFERGDQPGYVIATITDGESRTCWQENIPEDDDGDTTHEVCRKFIPNGTKYTVLPDELKFDPRNPTGHGILFINPNNNQVYCYWLPETA